MRGFHGAVAERDFGVVDALDAQTCSTPQIDPMTSRIASTAPTSWRCSSSGATPWIALSIAAIDLEGGVGRARDLLRDLQRIDQPMNLRHRSARAAAAECRSPLSRSARASAVHWLSNFDSRQSEHGWQSLEPALVETDVDKAPMNMSSGDAAGRVEDRNLHLLIGGADVVKQCGGPSRPATQ